MSCALKIHVRVSYPFTKCSVRGPVHYKGFGDGVENNEKKRICPKRDEQAGAWMKGKGNKLHGHLQVQTDTTTKKNMDRCQSNHRRGNAAEIREFQGSAVCVDPVGRREERVNSGADDLRGEGLGSSFGAACIVDKSFAIGELFEDLEDVEW